MSHILRSRAPLVYAPAYMSLSMRILIMGALVACSACGDDGDKAAGSQGDSGMRVGDDAGRMPDDAGMTPDEDAGMTRADAGMTSDEDAGMTPSEDAGMASDEIPMPAAGKAIFHATFSDVSDDFNAGGDEPFIGVEASGSAISALNAARWASATEAEVGTGDYIQIRVGKLWPEVGMTYAAAKGAGVEETSLVFGRYNLGATWHCDGSITITDLTGSTYSFTFESTSCTTGGAPGMGSMKLSGKGKANQL